MDYNLNNLNSHDFEFLAQSLTRKVLGNGTLVFGIGPDGGREATFEGIADFPGPSNQWRGYWVIQAKYKTVRTSEESKDLEWLKSEIRKELSKYSTRKSKARRPDNLIFFTNIILTPFPTSGGRDKISIFFKEMRRKYQIKNITVLGYDDINTYLNQFRDIAISFSSFILPGDILHELLELLEKSKSEAERTSELLARHLEIEFKNNISSKLEHAGKVTNERITLEKVFIDLNATRGGQDSDTRLKFIAKTLSQANQLLTPCLNKTYRYVLIAGPGYGKSTLTQYLCQVYIAYFLKKIDGHKNQLKHIGSFLDECNKTIKVLPSNPRLPFRIILKDYASWLREQVANKATYSVTSYLSHVINFNCGEPFFSASKVEDIITAVSTAFIFDGLDEVPISSNRKEVIDSINNFVDVILRRNNTDSLIICTSRPQGYTKEFNEDQYSHLVISDLGKDDCLNYIKKLIYNIEDDKQKQQSDVRTLEKALEDPIVSHLMRSPLQASIMTILVRLGGEPPRNKYELFTEYFLTLLKRERQKCVAKILIDHPSYITSIHNELGFELQVGSESKDSPSATISTRDFEELIHRYLKIEVGLDEDEINNYTVQIINACLSRLVFIEEVQDGQIGFNIRSIQEYFAANHYVSTPDAMIANRIKKIAIPSYWNNTLMFCIGNLFKNKPYTIDHVESICNELNGSEQEFGCSSLASIYKHGSWLSLDILNEGIFRGFRNYENKFSRHLTLLLKLPFIEKHLELTRLPENIKQDWLFKFVDIGLVSGDLVEEITCWVVLFSIAQSGPSINVEKYIPVWEEKKHCKELISSLNKGALFNSEFGREILVHTLKSGRHLEHFSLIKDLDKSSLSYCLNGSTDKKVASEVMAALLIVSFTTVTTGDIGPRSLDAIPMVVEVNVGRRRTEQHFRKRDFDYIIDPISVSRLQFIFGNNKDIIGKLASILDAYDIPFLHSLVSFYRKPSAQTLISFVGMSSNIEENSSLRQIIAGMNWLFRMVFKPGFHLNDLVQRIEKGAYGDSAMWKAIEQQAVTISSPKVRKDRSFSIDFASHILGDVGMQSFSFFNSENFIESMYESGLPQSIYTDVRSIKLDRHLADCSRIRFDKSGSTHDLILLVDMFESVYKNAVELTASDCYRLVILVSIIPDGLLISEAGRLNTIAEKIKLKTGNFPVEYDAEMMDRAIMRIIRVYPVVLQEYRKAPLIRVVALALVNPKFRYVYNVEYLLTELKLNEAENMDLFSLGCLYFVKYACTGGHSDALKETFGKVVFTNDLVELLLLIMQKFTVNTQIDWIFHLIAQNGEMNYTTYSLFILTLKNYAESRRSEIEPTVLSRD